MRRYILEITRGLRLRIAASALVGTARVAVGLAFVALSKRAVDIATGQSEGNLTGCILGLAGALIAELICQAAGNRNTELTEAAMKDRLQQRVFGRLLAAPWEGREKFHSGDLLSRLTDDCRVAAECLCHTVPAIAIAATQLAGAFAFLWYFSRMLAVILLLLLPAFLLAGKVFYRRVRDLSRRIRETESRLQEQMQESLQHRILLIAYRQTRRAADAVRALHRERYRLIGRRTNITVYSRTAMTAGFEAGYLTAFLWGVAGLRNGTVTFGLMTAYLQLAGQIQRPIAELARLLPGVVQAHTALSRLAETEGPAAEPEEEEPEPAGEAGVAGVVMTDVTFGYPGMEKPVVDGFSHIFAPGSITALTGETGAGKSTLLRLMAALVRPQSGTIELTDSEGVSQVSAATRSRIVYVPQGNSLMSGTIRSNLLTGKADATDEELREALHAAAAEFVYELDGGLDTPCGERGDGLSEGQAQRIAIARGLLRPGTILLLDEISASLDEATERVVMERLSERRGRNTVIMVTHRSGVLPYCDAVVRLER